MEIRTHKVSGVNIAEVLSGEMVITSVDDALDLIGNLNYQGFSAVILDAHNITAEFFDLKTKLAGEVLQKFTMYRLRLCIAGDFTSVESKSLRDFIFESNQGRQVNFVSSTAEAIAALSK